MSGGRGGASLPEWRDAFAFLELCPVRGVGATVAGGVMGAVFGAVFASYASLAPYDPALRDWHAAQAAHSAAAAARAAAGAAAGAGAGAGVAPPPLPPLPPPPPLPPSPPVLTMLREGLAHTAERSLASARSFAVMGGIFTTTECFLEKARGRRDVYNAVGAGFATGAVLAVRAGPTATLLGGAGFAAFSGVIDVLSPYFLEG